MPYSNYLVLIDRTAPKPKEVKVETFRIYYLIRTRKVKKFRLLSHHVMDSNV